METNAYNMSDVMPLPWLVQEKTPHCLHGGNTMAEIKQPTLPYPLAQFFPHVVYMPWDMIWMGLIWSLALGFAAGNYACSLVHRLPRGLGILEKKPYCGSCGTMLATKDLFPVVSALMLNHKCRYCGAAIPKSHFYTELLIGLLFCLCFLIFGFSESYLLVALLGSMLVVLASIEANEKKLDRRVLWVIAATGMIYRTLADGTIYSFFYGGLYGLIIGCLIFYRQIEKRGHIFVPPIPVLLMALGGTCVGDMKILIFLPAFAVLAFAMRYFPSKPPISLAFGLAVMLGILLL